MKNLLRLSFVLLAFATTGMFAQTVSAPSTSTQTVKTAAKGHGHKKGAKHKKKHQTRAKNS